MGKTAFGGPVYGAKSLLFSAQMALPALTSTVAQTFGATIVPSYEEWYITEFKAFRGSTGSTGALFELVDDSTIIGSVVIGSSVANATGSTTLTATPGEYEGLLVAAGSTLAITVTETSTTVGSSNIAGYAYGFIRYIDSTRAV